MSAGEKNAAESTSRGLSRADMLAEGFRALETSSAPTALIQVGRLTVETPWKRFFRKPSTFVYLGILLVVVLMSFIGPWFAGSAVAANNAVLLAPGSGFLFGTDELGRDYLPRVLHGGQVSITVGLTVALLCMTIGIVVGGIAGFYGGIIDTLLVRSAEFFQVLPGIVLALVAAALFSSNMTVIVIILAITLWPAVARIVRAEAMRIAQLGYVESARAAGFSNLRILWEEVIPNAMPPVLVATTMTVGRAVLIESSLSYLGIGDSNNPSWGALLNTAQGFMSNGWWLAVIPGLFIFIIVLAVNMLGDSLNDAFSPTIGKVK